MLRRTQRRGAVISLERSDSKALDDSGAYGARSLLDPEDPVGFSASEIRGAFLRFFVSIFRDYRHYVDEKGFRSEEFLASFNLWGPCLGFVNSIIKSPMFDRFLQERKDIPSTRLLLHFRYRHSFGNGHFRGAQLRHGVSQWRGFKPGSE